MSDDLATLIADLEKEVLPLERALRLREAEEAGAVRTLEGRIASAEARLARADAQLKTEAAQCALAERRRDGFRERALGWRGQVWSIGYGSAVVLSLLAAVAAFPLARTWFGGNVAFGIVAAQVVAFGILYGLIPPKR